MRILKLHHGLVILLIFLVACKQSSQSQNTKDSNIKNSTTTACKIDLNNELDVVTKELTGTPYSAKKGTDCSGIFHKVIDALSVHCSNLEFPKFGVDRSSRDLLKWYHEKGQLSLIRNPSKASSLIKKGAIMFYGQSGKHYSEQDRREMSISELIDLSTGVNHLGIVMNVERKGKKIISYEIFHGKKPGVAAGVSRLKCKETNSNEACTYRHGNQAWLAIAQLLERK